MHEINFRTQYILYYNDAIHTSSPIIGDVGAITVFDDGKMTGTRFGVWGGIEETTGRGLVLTSDRGFGHRRIEGIVMAHSAGNMVVIGTLTPESYARLWTNIRMSGDNEALEE